jgi:hypothetical protein
MMARGMCHTAVAYPIIRLEGLRTSTKALGNCNVLVGIRTVNSRMGDCGDGDRHKTEARLTHFVLREIITWRIVV